MALRSGVSDHDWLGGHGAGVKLGDAKDGFG